MNSDVLVVGSGPAGTAAALTLARHGIRVTLIDRRAFPREKICGDALIPDALRALKELGLRERVLQEAKILDEIRLFSANGSFASLCGQSACLPRIVFDNILLRAAMEAGVQFLSEHTAELPILENGNVGGAVVQSGRTARTQIRAPTTLLACGADAAVLQRFGVCTRTMPSAVACRLYYHVEPEAAKDLQFLCLSYVQQIGAGYGWIFPGPDNIFNVGVGLFYDSRASASQVNLHSLFDHFLNTFQAATAVTRHGKPLSSLQGAPLRTALTGSALAKPGLLVIGEAAGLTYSFSGEGIGKALESGILAAEIIREARSHSQGSNYIAEQYADRLKRSYGSRFGAYRRAQEWLAKPWVGNLLTRRAKPGSYVRQQLEAIYNETSDPSVLFSLIGLLRAIAR